MVDWRSGITCFSGGGNVCVYGLCMGFDVHIALFGLIQSGNVTEGFKPCWRTGQSARLETILFSAGGRSPSGGSRVVKLKA